MVFVREIASLREFEEYDLTNPSCIEPSARSRDMTPYEGMDAELMKISLGVAEDFDAARRRMTPIRSSKALKPGVYYNAGTRMVERLHSSQRPPLGNRMYRISKNSDESAEELERKITGGGKWWRRGF